MDPLYIFDLDGTLALNGHREHFINPPEGCAKRVNTAKKCDCIAMCKFKPDWRRFFAACVDDEPNLPVIDTMLSLISSGADVWIWSGRSSEVMEETKAWLQNHLSLESENIPLCMRVEGDFTPDEQLKQAWLEQMSAHDRRRLVAVFDDREKVVAMWRANGVACFQVAPGAF